MNKEVKKTKKNKSTINKNDLDLDIQIKKDDDNKKTKKNKSVNNTTNDDNELEKLDNNEIDSEKIHRSIDVKKSKEDININPNKKITYIDLFCGMGSFHFSFKNFGWNCIMACDINKAAKNNYNQNFKLLPLDDICNINPKTIDNYDILCAGFPCQPFSQIGKHLGFDDERGTMFNQIMKFVKYHKPKIIILENVRALISHDNGNTLNKIINDIKKENYHIVYDVLNCSDYGIPQMRKRLFIIAVKLGINDKNIAQIFNLNEYKKNITLSEYLGKNFIKKYAYTIRCGGKNSPINDKHNWDGYYVDDKEYRLSLDDCFKLQGFNNYELSGTDKDKWKLLGNTIPTIFTEIIGKQLLKLFFNSDM